ncbi:MAG TPA: alpha/beta hydrolase [Candidatus Paceibacterota bacterium]|nr:alpha/beta hydrolase [Candidatus Paceibacterota bacterium]
MKTNILLIHGGMTFKNRKDYLKYLKERSIDLKGYKSWTDEYLAEKLGRNYQIIKPRMPLKDNSRYEDWKIHFERYLPLLGKKFVLIGNSLGGIFLAKYLSENKLKTKPLGTFLVCPPFDDTIPTEDLVNGFKLKSNISMLENNTEKLYLMFSENDDCAPVSHAEKYRSKLPNSKIIIYKNKNGHFKIAKFPEIVRLIKGL